MVGTFTWCSVLVVDSFSFSSDLSQDTNVEFLMSPVMHRSETFPDQVNCIIKVFSTSFDFA